MPTFSPLSVRLWQIESAIVVFANSAALILYLWEYMRYTKKEKEFDATNNSHEAIQRRNQNWKGNCFSMRRLSQVSKVISLICFWMSTFIFSISKYCTFLYTASTYSFNLN